MATPAEKESFSLGIERRIQMSNVSIMEAIMDFCEVTGLEVEVAASLLTDPLKVKLAEQVRVLHLLKKDVPPPAPAKVVVVKKVAKPVVKTGKNLAKKKAVKKGKK